MKTPTNTFKKAIQSGQPQFGFWVGLIDPVCAEIAASSGFDWVLIDGEHAPNSPRSILHQLQAAAAHPTQAVVRPVEGTQAIIKQLLDVGAQTLLIPLVETAEQAQMLVESCHYPPNGTRGVGTALARAANWGRTTDYLQRADEEICLLVQVETRRGLDNLEAILAVDGVDGVFIGPADLSGSLGHLGNPGHPDVVEAIEQAIETIRSTGKAAGILATDPKLAHHYRQQGVLFIAVGVDTMVLARGAAGLAAEFKTEVDAPTASGGVY